MRWNNRIATRVRLLNWSDSGDCFSEETKKEILADLDAYKVNVSEGLLERHRTLSQDRVATRDRHTITQLENHAAEDD